MSKELTTISDTRNDTGGTSRAGLTPAALITDGSSLVYILDSKLEEGLFQLACSCSMVLYCGVAPLQKAGMVASVKKRHVDKTLAIGDGATASDVSIISMADVGVGISGQEGRQVVMASDSAMRQFRFLYPLLFVHGHWNYQRMGYMVLYSFYRNTVYVLFTRFTLTTAIRVEQCVVFHNLRIVAYDCDRILDKDLSRRKCFKVPSVMWCRANTRMLRPYSKS
ncbi:hypothetical protein GQ457_06G016590 [Hibiscus cannabinus]